MALKDWSETAASNTTAGTGVACDEGQQAGTVNNGVRELMAQVKTAHLDAQWLQRGDSITFLAANQFQVNNVSDQTAYGTDRRVRVTGAITGTIVGTVTAVVSSPPNLQVTVSFDSGTMSNEALEVETGILSGVEQSIPARIRGTKTFSSDVNIEGDLILQAGTGLIRGASLVTDNVRATSSGASPFALASINYTKKFTGPLVVVAMIGMQVDATAGPTYFLYDTAALQSGFLLAPTMPVGEFFHLTHISHFSSVSAGAQVLGVSARRSDAAVMGLTYNPNQTDDATLPSSSMSHYLFLEL